MLTANSEEKERNNKITIILNKSDKLDRAHGHTQHSDNTAIQRHQVTAKKNKCVLTLLFKNGGKIVKNNLICSHIFQLIDMYTPVGSLLAVS